MVKEGTLVGTTRLGLLVEGKSVELLVGRSAEGATGDELVKPGGPRGRQLRGESNSRCGFVVRM